MAQLFIGALGPQAGSTAISLLDSGLTIHRVGNVTDHNTVFEVQDRGRMMYLKNMRSTVSLEGWTMAPQIYEAENANISNAAVKNVTSSATGKKYVNAANGNETTYIQWNVAVPSAGEYLISLRYAHENSPRPLDVSDSILGTHQHVLLACCTHAWTSPRIGLREHTVSGSSSCQPKQFTPICQRWLRPCWCAIASSALCG